MSRWGVGADGGRNVLSNRVILSKRPVKSAALGRSEALHELLGYQGRPTTEGTLFLPPLPISAADCVGTGEGGDVCCVLCVVAGAAKRPWVICMGRRTHFQFPPLTNGKFHFHSLSFSFLPHWIPLGVWSLLWQCDTVLGDAPAFTSL